MAENNNDLVNLGDLGSASPDEIRKALAGQPKPVEESAPQVPDDELVGPPEQKRSYLDLGGYENNIVADDKGNAQFINPYSSFERIDLDQFETQGKLVSNDSPLSGILNRVEGLDEGYVYTGVEDTARRSQEAQGVVNKMKNGIVQFHAEVGLNIAQGFGTLLYGVPSAIINGDFTKIYDNALAKNLDKGQEFVDEYWNIKRGGNQSGMQKAANFIFDDFLGGASFVAGAIATELLWSAATAATFGGAAPAQVAGTAGIVARGTRLLSKAMNGGKYLMGGGMIDDALKGAAQLSAQSTRQAAGEALRTAGRAISRPQNLQAGAKLTRQIVTGAGMESGMEARHMLNAAVENQRMQYEELNGRGSFTDEMAEAFREEISGHADGVFGVNLALVSASNMMMFPRLFGVGLNRGMQTARFIDTSKLSAKARQQLAKNLGVAEGALPKLVDAARGNTFGRVVGRTGNFGRIVQRNMGNAMYEGFVEEGLQGTFSRTAEDYISKKYDPRGVQQTANYAESFLEGLQGSYTTAEGFKEIGLGMLLAFTGVPMYTRTKTADGKGKWKVQMMGGWVDQRAQMLAQDKQMDAIIALNEKHGDVGGILKAEIENMNRQNVLQREQELAAGMGDFKRAKDIESDMTFSHAASKIVTGRYEQALGEAKQALEEMSEDELRDQLGPAAKNMTDEEVREHRSKVYEAYKARMERARQAYEQAGEVYRGKDPDVHTGVAHMLFNIEELDAREKRIAEAMAKAIEGDFSQDTVLDVVRAQAELGMTQEQVADLAKRVQKIQNIDKALKTKMERNIIKNIDPDKAEARQKEIAELQVQKAEEEQFVEQMLEEMAVAKNVDRAKYAYDPAFLENLRLLHAAVTRQNPNIEYRGEDIQRQYDDLMAIAADRFWLIENYNDFIKPGGVERFEERMRGSIEALADMTPEEREAKAKEEAAAEDTEEARKEAEAPEPPVSRTDDSIPNEPSDTGSGAFSVPRGMEEQASDAAQRGFPEPAAVQESTVPDLDNKPPSVVTADEYEARQEGKVSANQDEDADVPAEEPQVAVPTAPEVEEPTSRPPNQSDFGKAKIRLINGYYGNGRMYKPESAGVVAELYAGGFPAGTQLVARQVESGFSIETKEGDRVAFVKLDEAPQGMRLAVRANNGVLPITTTTDVRFGLVGGEKVRRYNTTDQTVEEVLPLEQRRVSNVLPDATKDITGAAVAGRSNMKKVGSLRMANADIAEYDRYVGNLYISTRDSRTGREAWHSIQIDHFGQKRAQQLMDTIDAYNKFATNQQLSPEEMQLLDKFFEAARIDKNRPIAEVAQLVAGRLQRTIPQALSSKQKIKLERFAENNRKHKPLFTVHKDAKHNTVSLSFQQLTPNGKSVMKPVFSHEAGNRPGFPIPGNHQDVLLKLAGTRMNLAIEKDAIVVPDGNGEFRQMLQKEMIVEFGSFSDRMPIVINGNIYNSIPMDFEFAYAPLVEVPTEDRLPDETAQEEERKESLTDALPTNLDDIDLGDEEFLPDAALKPTEEATDPMDRAGASYDIPGLTPREIRDGLNFSAGIMARAMMVHLRTKKRRSNVRAGSLRSKVKQALEAQLAALREKTPSATRDRMIAAHEAWLDDKNFNRLVDMAMLEMLRQTKGIIEVRRGNVEDAIQTLSDDVLSANEVEEEEDATRSENPLAAFDDNFAFGVDPKSTLRMEAKMLLQTLQHKITATNPATVRTFGLAGARFLNVDDLMGKVNASLEGVNPDWESVKTRLEEAAATYPELQVLLDAMTDQAAVDSLPPSVMEQGESTVQRIIKNAKDIQDMIRNQFVVYASKVATIFDYMRMQSEVRRPLTGEVTQWADVEIYSSNQRNMREFVKADIRSILIQHDFFTLDGQVNKDKIAKVLRAFDDIAETPEADRAVALSRLLEKEFGIKIPPTALTSQNATMVRGRKIFNNVEKDLANVRSSRSGVGRMRSVLRAISNGKMDMEALISDDSRPGQGFVDFFVGLADYRENFIQNSSKDGDNKTRWHYSAPKLLHQMLTDIVWNGQADILKDRIGALVDKEAGVDARKAIKIHYIDGIRQGNEGKKRDFHDMEPGDLTMAKLALYGNRGRYRMLPNKNVHMAGFLMPTLADKHTMPIVYMPALTVTQFKLNPDVLKKAPASIRFRDLVGNVDAVYAATMGKSIVAERDRIIRLYQGDTDGMTDAQRNAWGFVMAPGLNHLAQELKDKKITLAQFKEKVDAEARGMWEATMDRDLQYNLQQTEGVAWNIGEKGEFSSADHFNPSNPRYKWVARDVGLEEKENTQYTVEEQNLAFLSFLAKYTADSMGMRTALVFDVMGDPGAFVKHDENGIKVTKTATNMGKRFASLIAPGNAIPYVSWTVGNKTVSNKNVRTLVMPARIVDKAAHYAFLKRLGQTPDQLAMQEGYDSADAAEYTTVEEHLGILYAQGKISRNEMDGLLTKIRKQEAVARKYAASTDPKEQEKLKAQMKELELDEQQMGWFQPMKPVTSGRVGDHMLYVKSASFPLVPQLTIGTEIDKLRVFMEKNDIQRAAFDSAVKLGNQWADVNDPNATEDQKMVEVFKGSDVEISDALQDRVITYDRRFMRIQQEVPVGKVKEKVHGSQVAKLLLVDLADAMFELNGKPIRGKDMYGLYMTARQDEIDARLELFAQKYGMRYDAAIKQVYHTAESRKAFAERIMDEAITRGYDVNELAHLHYDLQEGKFTTPLLAGPSQDRIENLIKAVIFKEVYEPRISGFSGPIRPEVGIKSLSEVDAGDIMWVKKGKVKLFKGEKLAVAQDEQLDQIIMPWKYKAKLDKYLDEDGNIKGDELPAELLKTFAYRIPGQRKSSSTAFEIVGFLPESYGDTLIVNEELVGRIGQDYDIDKMFGFLYDVDQAEDGTISVIREDNADAPSVNRRVSIARNKQLDIYIASMESTDKLAQQAKHAPVTDGYAEELAGHLTLVSDNTDMPMGEAYNANKVDVARSGKSSIGVFAVQNVLHAQLEQFLNYVDSTITYTHGGAGFVRILENRDSKKGRVSTLGDGNIHDKTFLFTYTKNGKVYTPVAGKKSEQFGRLLNHAVDNENNQLLSKLGINKDTWSIYTGLTHMGYNQETIALFANMPIVKEYAADKSKRRQLGLRGGSTLGTRMLELSNQLEAFGPEYLEAIGDYDKARELGLPVLNKQDMFEIVTGVSELTEQQRIFLDLQILDAIGKLDKFKKDVQRVGDMLRVDTNRPESIVAMQIAMAKIDKTLITKRTAKKMSINIDHIKDELLRSTVAGQVTNQVRLTYRNLFDIDGMMESYFVKILSDAVDKADLQGRTEDHVITLLKGHKSQAYVRFLKNAFGKDAATVREEAHDVRTGGIAKRLMTMRKTKPEIAQNFFVQQLIAVNRPGQYPHLEFTGDRQLEANPIEVHRAFLNLLRSKDAEVRDFAEELVVYALATSGGRLKSRGYLKYIPAEYLQSKGLGKYVNAQTMSIGDITQTVRHNPDLATQYYKRTDAYKKNFKTEGGMLMLDTEAASLNGHVRIGKRLYVPVDVITDEASHEWYVLKPATTLGDYLSDEYSVNDIPLDKEKPRVRMIGDFVDPVGMAPMPPALTHDEAPGHTDRDVPPGPTGDFNYTIPKLKALTPVPTEDTHGQAFDGPPSDGAVDGRKAVNDAVVRNKEAQDSNKTMLDYLKEQGINHPYLYEMLTRMQVLDPGNPIKVVVNEGETASSYSAVTNTITLSGEAVRSKRHIVHETVHALTVFGMRAAEGKIPAPEVDLAELKRSHENLKRLLAEATTPENLAKMGLSNAGLNQARRGYQVWLRHRQGVKDLTAEQRTDLLFFLDNRDKYYGFLKPTEMVAEAFSNKVFAQQLSKLDSKATKKNSWLSRFIDQIKAVLESLGIKENISGTMLEDVYRLSMDIAERQVEPDFSEEQVPFDLDLEFLPDSQLDGYRMKGLDQLVAYKKKRIRQFDELKSRYANDREFVRRVHARQIMEQKELDRLTDDSVEITPDYLLDMGQRELDFARRTISSVVATDPEIGMALSALENIYSIVEFYDQAREILNDPLLRETANTLRREASQLRDDYLEKARIILREDARRMFAGKGVNIDASTFEELQDSGFLKSMFQDASRQGSTELAFLDKIVRDAAQKQRVEFNRRAKLFMDKSAAMKKGAYFKKHKWNGFVELDSKGNPTPHLISMFSGRFDDAVSQKRKQLKPKEFYKWLNSVTDRVDIEQIFDVQEDTVVRKNNPAYVKYLENKFGTAGAQEVLNQQETLLQTYVDARAAAFDNIEMTVPQEGQEQAKADWVKKNSPANAFKAARGNKKFFGTSSKYLLDFPLREVNGKSTGFYDSRFMEMMNDPAAMEFYNEYRKQMMELGRMLPRHKMAKQEHLLRNGLFVPAITKTLMEELMGKDGYMEKVGRLGDHMKASLTVTGKENINELIDPITGRPRKELSVMMLGEIDPKDQDYDMDRTFLAFAMMATTYHSKNAIEDKVSMVQSVMGNATIVKGEVSGVERALNKVGIGMRDGRARQNVMRSVDTIVDTFYGYQNTDDLTVEAPERMWTAKQKEEIERLRQEVDSALSDEAKAEAQARLDKAIPKLSGAKGVRNLQQFAQAKGMAYNLPAALTNLIFGGLSVFKHAAGRTDFTEKELRKATALMMHSSLNMLTLNSGLTKTDKARKIQNMMINLDQLKDYTEMRYDVRKFAKQASESGVAASAQQGFSKLRMYEIQRSSEYFVYGMGTIAHLMSVQVDGKSLWDHMDDNGVIQLDGYRPGEQKHIDLMNRLDQINKRIHGNYDPNSPIAIKKTFIGPLLMQFRSWLPEAIATRFEEEKYDAYLDRKVKGTFRTMFTSGATMKHLKAMMPQLLPSFIRTKGMDTLPQDISELDQENIRKFAAGVRQWIQATVFLALLKALKDDEDDEESLYLLNAALNVGSRVENDLQLFGDPRSMYELTQGDAFAAIGILEAAADLFDATKDTILGDSEIPTGVYAGKNRMLHHGGKLIPHLNALQRIANNLDRELN